jgi:hypothetical protein
VCQPFSYNSRQTPNQKSSRLSVRLLQFVLPVIILSVIINFPRFFEVTLVSSFHNVTSYKNVTELQEYVSMSITDLRMDPDYIRY